MRIPRSRYTGENRCWPCTVVNLVIAAVVTIILFPYFPVLSGLVFFVSTLSIAFIGYLVPGTPYLTRKMLPDRVLARFRKASSELDTRQTDGDNPGIDRLIQAGVLESHNDGTLSLSDSFNNSWSNRIESLRNNERAPREEFATMVGVEPDDVSFERIDATGALSVRIKDGPVSQWLSRAALVADIAASGTLAAWDREWNARSVWKRHAILVSLRQFRNQCPLCDGSIVSRVESTESCCWTRKSITARCEECELRLYVISESSE